MSTMDKISTEHSPTAAISPRTDPFCFLGEMVTVRMDRPLGSRHPKHKFIYPLNYGFIPGTIAPDGAEVDAYVLGVFDPVEEFEGVCRAVIHRTDDDDDKIVVMPLRNDYTDDQIRALTEFQERFFTSEIVRVKITQGS